jgi:hypothetical protein
MNTDNTRLLEKIQALLNKANCSGVTPEESQAFFGKAQELLTKHGLEMADLNVLQSGDDMDFAILHETFQTGRSEHEADSYLWKIIEKCFGVKVVFTKYAAGDSIKHGYILVGDEFQVAVAKLAIPLVYKTMTQGARRFIKENHIKKSAAVKRSFFKGVQDGYLQHSEQGREMAMAQATKEQREAYGLILVGKRDAIQKYAQDRLNLKPRKTAVRSGFNDGAYDSGVNTGKNMDLNFRNKLS